MYIKGEEVLGVPNAQGGPARPEDGSLADIVGYVGGRQWSLERLGRNITVRLHTGRLEVGTPTERVQLRRFIDALIALEAEP